jgi:hypothetical protein
MYAAVRLAKKPHFRSVLANSSICAPSYMGAGRPRLHTQAGLLFGLDARIALGIFAALALVVGYIGFGRVQGARDAVLVKELLTLEEALANLQADLGVFLPFALATGPDGALDDPRHLAVLWDHTLLKPSMLNLWHGPYVHRRSLQQPPFGTFGVAYAADAPGTPCDADTKCSIWLTLTKVPPKQQAMLEETLDQALKTSTAEPNPQSTGRVRSEGVGEATTLYYQTRVQRLTL